MGQAPLSTAMSSEGLQVWITDNGASPDAVPSWLETDDTGVGTRLSLDISPRCSEPNEPWLGTPCAIRCAPMVQAS